MARSKNNRIINQTLFVLGKEELVWKILHFDGRFPFDFTSDYLSGLSINKLRHILYAANIINC